MSSIPKAHPEH